MTDEEKKAAEPKTIPIKGLTTLACFEDGYQIELRKDYIKRVPEHIAKMLIERGYAIRTDQAHIETLSSGSSAKGREIANRVLETRLQIAKSQWKAKMPPEKYLTLYPNGPQAGAARKILGLEKEIAKKSEA